MVVPGRSVRAPTTAQERERVTHELDIEALYRAYGDLVLGRCRNLLRSDSDAEEACQEVFLRLWRYRDSFRGEASPSTFLFKITTSTCLNRLRTRRRHPEELVDELPGGAVSDGMLDELEARQLLSSLTAAEDERTMACLVYHHLDGMTHDEVGELLGISGAAVRKRISTFRDRARAQYDASRTGSTKESP
jgi:RNA polymerase sigma-70 factor (ECF subfamily)